MSSDQPAFPGRSDGAVAWPTAEMLVEYRIAVPREEQARLVAAALAERGHRWVRMRPVYLPHLDPRNRLFGKPQFSRPELEGWWHVSSLVDEQAPDQDAEFYQHSCEQAAVTSAARAHGGFADGGSMARRETMLSHLDHSGSVHELSMDQAHAVRRAVIADFPPPREQMAPSTPLQHPDDDRGFPSLLESVRLAAQEMRSPHGDLPEGTAWWLSEEADGFEDDRELLFELVDAVIHQGTCYPHTFREVPLLAALAAHAGVQPVYRAFLVAFLVEVGTIGQRLAASDTDRRVALGLGLGESDDEQAARLAVEAAAPRLLAQWNDECEAVQFTLAALAAVCPAAAEYTGAIAGMKRLADNTPQPHRAAALRLAVHLAEEDDHALAAGLGEVIESALISIDESPSPCAPMRGASLNILKHMIEQELSLLLIA